MLVLLILPVCGLSPARLCICGVLLLHPLNAFPPCFFPAQHVPACIAANSIFAIDRKHPCGWCSCLRQIAWPRPVPSRLFPGCIRLPASLVVRCIRAFPHSPFFTVCTGYEEKRPFMLPDGQMRCFSLFSSRFWLCSLSFRRALRGRAFPSLHRRLLSARPFLRPNQALWPKAYQILPVCPSQCQAHQIGVFRPVKLKQRALHALSLIHI